MHCRCVFIFISCVYVAAFVFRSVSSVGALGSLFFWSSYIFGVMGPAGLLPSLRLTAFLPPVFPRPTLTACRSSVPLKVMPHDYKRVLGEMAEAKAQGIDWDEDEEGKSMVA